MKTLKITLVATTASMIAWWLHLPAKIWSEHPLLADFLLALTLCVVLQLVWSDPERTMKPVAKNDGTDNTTAR